MNFPSDCKQYLRDFEKQCCEGDNRIPYVVKGVLNIESFYWWSLIAGLRPEMVLESGVSQGRSTEIIARACNQYNVRRHYAFDCDDTFASVARKRLKPYKRTKYIIRDSAEGFREVFDNESGKVVVILDGPKTLNGIKSVFRNILPYKDRILAIGSHDCEPGSKVRNHFTGCVDRFMKKGVIVTEPDADLGHLNVCLMSEIEQEKGEKSYDLINKSHYVGVCIL